MYFRLLLLKIILHSLTGNKWFVSYAKKFQHGPQTHLIVDKLHNVVYEALQLQKELRVGILSPILHL